MRCRSHLESHPRSQSLEFNKDAFVAVTFASHERVPPPSEIRPVMHQEKPNLLGES
jgi:hypothetical protein